MATATYTKLRSGEWGIRLIGRATEGQMVSVAKKSGETKSETIARVVWTGRDSRSGESVSLCAIGSTRSPQRGGSGHSRRGTWTGCSCGSVEEYERASDCWTCRHDR